MVKMEFASRWGKVERKMGSSDIALGARAGATGSMLVLVCLFVLVSAKGFAAAPPVTTDEFVGPFSSWMNVKTDFGAVEDGTADDTTAIQQALETVRFHKSSFVLYFPAGVYRITNTVKLLRTTNDEAHGIAIYGEDPEKTIIRWDGPADGIMCYYNPWYSAMERLTFDGQGRANTPRMEGKRRSLRFLLE